MFVFTDRPAQPAGYSAFAEGAIVTIKGFVDRHQPPPRGNASAPYRVFIHDDTGELAPHLFPGQGQLAGKGAARRRGRDRLRQGQLVQRPPSMVHPDYAATVEDMDKLPLVEPVYPMTAGLSPKALRKAVRRRSSGCPICRMAGCVADGQTQLPSVKRASSGCTTHAMRRPRLAGAGSPQAGL